MPLLSTERKVFTEVVKGVAEFENISGVDYNYARAACEGSAAIEPMGVPMVWVAASDAFEVFVAQAIPTVDSSLPDGSPVCIVVGQKEGRGVNKADVTLSSTSQDLTVLYKGAAVIVSEGVTWGSISGANKALFLKALAKQDILSTTSATVADPAYV